MDILDVVIILAVLGAAIHGLRLGAAVQVLSFGGALLGLILGIVLVLSISPHVHGQFGRTFVALLLLLVPCAVIWGVGRQLGVKAWGRLQRSKVAKVDAAAGAAIAMAGTLVFVWLLASMLVNTQLQSVAKQINDSRIIRSVTDVMPPIPNELGSVERLLAVHGFPLAFYGDPGFAAPVKLPTTAAVRAAVSAAGSSTVRVVAYGCANGDIVQKGSGFVVGNGYVVTNAHVVAGATHVVVADEVQDHQATVVFFDPEFDLAVLRIPGLTDRPLHLDTSYVGRGTTAAVLGYPGGGPFEARAAGVMLRIDATGADIYNQRTTTREIYEINAIVRPGNSGGPLVEPNGTVIGVVFSRSATNNDIGFALASPDVSKRVAQAERAPAGTVVGTGRCTSG